jgi:fluoroacetyl-CoA thioesterase
VVAAVGEGLPALVAVRRRFVRAPLDHGRNLTAVADLKRKVTAEDTADALGSGDVPVLGTPRLLAWIEAATVLAAAPVLGEGETSVGTRVDLQHLVALRVGAEVWVRATLAHRDGRLLRFEAGVEDERGRVVATAAVTRVVVDRQRFVDRL